MSEISITNTEWEIIDDVREALAGATVDGDPVFKSVTIATSEAQAEEVQFAGDTPRAIILLDGLTEMHGVATQRDFVLRLELLIATKVSSGADESDRLKELLRLINGTKNAVETDAPTDATGVAEENFHEEIEWGEPDLSPTETARQPWVGCRLPVAIGFGIASPTAH